MSLSPVSGALHAFSSTEQRPKRHKSNLHIQQREIGARVCFDDLIDKRIYENIRDSCFSESTFNTDPSFVSSMCIRGNILVTLNFANHISCYNLELKKLRWELNQSSKLYWDRLKIKIRENNIICSGILETQNGFTKTIRFIDIDNGKQVAEITDPHLETPKYRIIGNHFFCFRDNGKIGMWDLKGNPIRDIDTGMDDTVLNFTFTGKGNYLAYTINHFVFFSYHIETNTTARYELYIDDDHSLALREVSPEYVDLQDETMISERLVIVKSLHFFNNELICTLEKNIDKEDNDEAIPAFCIIDLDKKVITYQCQLREETQDTQIQCKFFPKKNITYNSKWIAFHHLSGTLFAVNPGEDQQVILGKVNATSLKIHKNFLACVNDSKYGDKGEIRFWDLGRMRKVDGVITVPTLFKVGLALGKVVMVTDKLLVRDYL